MPSDPESVLPIGAALRVLAPESPQAHAMFNLGVVTAIILGAIFVIVAGLIVYALMRFRWREGEPEPVQLAGNLKIEIIWTAIPCAIVAALFMLTARAMSLADPPPAPAPDLIVTGHQWWWEVRYPESGVVTANEIHLPVGRPFSVKLESSDVLHEFWVPELARKITAVPGHPNHLWLEADRTGTFLGICSEFCGTQHAWMHFSVIVESPADFAAWQKAQLRPAAAPAAGAAAEGLALFARTSCLSCHAIAGTAARARVGPDLTHFASRRHLGAGIAANTAANLRRWLTNPQEVKPGVKMPDFKFTDQQVTQLVAYLETLQ
ncbi:cytochrome c oxidase subunit II [Horticoccus luteus]|uniref:Cytochrome c oxidase subunit 2 n=1 Tax=Horticoccus luteus TaxID=2862869 RepID=A0A8F9XGI6_9BACT|nr:cytochrome c oxidase subunit II [Horticoccus luteus]QYM78265.1 cytochrome c oxidase subunit II [Horticoccus luteus]